MGEMGRRMAEKYLNVEQYVSNIEQVIEEV